MSSADPTLQSPSDPKQSSALDAGLATLVDPTVTDAASRLDTQPTTSVALDATVAAPPVGDGGGAWRPSPSATETLARSTVLPHVEVWEGELRVTQQRRRRYEDVRPLGEGGMGEVVLARDNDIERVVAVKRLLPHLAGTTAITRFAEEIRTVGQLGHPGIPPVHDVGVDEHGKLYFVMKYVDGETLEDIIARLAAGDPATHAAYPFERRVELIMSLLETLAYAHAQGIVHRDIKPANVMVGAYGEVVLMDWGIAKGAGLTADVSETLQDGVGVASGAARLHQTEHGALVGTPVYMSPEQAARRLDAIDARSDVYALSVVMHELLTLRHYLHDREDLRQVLEGVANRSPAVHGPEWELSAVQGPVAADLRHLVAKGMAKDPSRRFPSAQAMLDRLRRRAEGDIPVECTVTFWMSTLARTRRFLDRHPYVTILSIVAFLVLSIASMFYAAARLALG
ncbi:MAG TPA: serine/threonine-protein kinase [Polyangiaceae bacterium]|nr:serine/threonine-protein kinase [Polyangiaceae bacterium]